jgi:ATP-dependent exoDNAse (exonuclease V) beta subunit
MEAANALLSHPGPLEQAQTHIRALLAAGQEILAHYAQAKREAGLVDYSDMVALAAALLRARPDVLDTLVGRIDCLVVDEFQDTNPTQFALLWQIKQADVPTIVVGDLKQAIMGFQGADARLFEAIIAQQGNKAKPLTKNWRSQPALVDFVNALGPGLFPGAYQALAPQREISVKQALELMVFAKRAKSGQHAVRAYSLGQRLRTLLTDNAHPLTDRHTGKARSLRGGDIAVLCPTHGMLGAYAEELRRQGLRVRQAAHCWLDSRPIQMMWYALAYVANPDDRHAALYLAVTELGRLLLQSALEQLMQDGRIDDPILTQLDAIAAQAQTQPVDAVVTATIRALGLFDQVMHWPDAEQARANLVRLQSEAVAFTDSHPDARAQAGLFGAGIPSFLAWLATQVEGRDGDRQPDPRVIDEDAIVLSTWHAAKGREWPLVCVCGLEYSIKATVPSLGLGYPRFDDLARVLDEARIEYAPTFAAPESNEPFVQRLQAAQETSARRLLYVALTRARDKLILEWPAFQDDKDSCTYYSILRQEGGASLDAKGVKVGKKKFPCVITAGAEQMLEEAEDADELEPTPLPVICRRAIRRDAPPPALTQDSLTPSQMHAGSAATDTSGLELQRYGSGRTVTVGLSGLERGTFIHRCFEVLGARPALAGQGCDRLKQITGVDIKPKDFDRIAAAVESFETWLRKTFQPTAIKREWPVAALNAQGSLVTGTADLIVETKQGCWIIDHKSDKTDDPLAGFALYRPQLQAYADALIAAGSKVLGIAVHWTHRGEFANLLFLYSILIQVSSNSLLSRCPAVPLSRCPAVPLSRCPPLLCPQ